MKTTPTTAQLQKLKTAAKAAAGRAYAPYSKFCVGAAILTASGKIYSGCNVENASYGLSNCAERTAIFNAVAASYGLSNCAERTAIFNAVAAGEKKLKLQCVVVYTPTDMPTAPCGACRQVINEFGPDARILSICRGQGHIASSTHELLPDAFGPANLA